MTQNISLPSGSEAIEPFFRTTQEMLGASAPSLVLTVLNGTTIQAVAGTGNAQQTVAIQGRYRYITSTVSAAHPGGAAGTYNVFVTASDNSFTLGSTTTDSTVYAFGLQILATGSSPSTALYRQVGYVEWSGTAITALVTAAGAQNGYQPLVPVAPLATMSALRVRAAASQSAAIATFESSAGVALTRIGPAGHLDLSNVTGTAAPTGTSTGDKLGLSGTGSSFYGLGVQTNRLVAAVPTGGGFSVRVAQGSGNATSGTDVITLSAGGGITATGGLSLGAGLAIAGNLAITTTGATTYIWRNYANSGDTQPNFAVDNTGSLYWGAGGTTAVDCLLTRDATTTNALKFSLVQTITMPTTVQGPRGSAITWQAVKTGGAVAHSLTMTGDGTTATLQAFPGTGGTGPQLSLTGGGAIMQGSTSTGTAGLGELILSNGGYATLSASTTTGTTLAYLQMDNAGNIMLQGTTATGSATLGKLNITSNGQVTLQATNGSGVNAGNLNLDPSGNVNATPGTGGGFVMPAAAAQASTSSGNGAAAPTYVWLQGQVGQATSAASATGGTGANIQISTGAGGNGTGASGVAGNGGDFSIFLGNQASTGTGGSPGRLFVSSHSANLLALQPGGGSQISAVTTAGAVLGYVNLASTGQVTAQATNSSGGTALGYIHINNDGTINIQSTTSGGAPTSAMSFDSSQNLNSYYGTTAHAYWYSATNTLALDNVGNLSARGSFYPGTFGGGIQSSYCIYNVSNGLTTNGTWSITGGGGTRPPTGNGVAIGNNSLGSGEMGFYNTNSSASTSAIFSFQWWNGSSWVGVTTLASSGTFTPSDSRLKTNIAPLAQSFDAIGILKAIEPKTFDWIATEESDVGFIAQEIQKYLPSAVNEQPHLDDEVGMLGLSRDHLIAPLWQACREMLDRIEELESKLAA